MLLGKNSHIYHHDNRHRKKFCLSSFVFRVQTSHAVPGCYRQHCAQRKASVFKLLRGRFWGFSPRWGDTLHRLGVKFGTEEGTKPVPNCTPMSATIRV